MKMVTGGSCALLLALTTHGHALKAASSCESLSSLALPNTSITLAKTVAAGAFTLPETGPAVPQFSQLPTFCRVAATLTPSSDSDIKIEVWLPAQAWNGKFQAVGNGGWAGTISYGALASALQEGYATASTDTGHVGGNASFAIGHPEKVVDFAYRAVHEMAVKSKAIIAAFYDRAPRFSYWTGCSTGGRQALMEAQRYPDDFDGIIAGAPANNQTQLCAWRIAVEARTLQDPASVVPVAKLALVNRAVLAACDALDGVTDRLLTDPHQCHFDPATILCRGVDRDDCLTARQVEAVKMGYAPATRRTGELIYPGLVPGGEMGWAMLTGAKPEPGGIDVGMFRFVAHEDPAWDWRTFDQDVRPWYHVGRPGRGFCPDGRQTLPWDYFRVARHQGTSPQITDEWWTYDKKCGVSLSYVPFLRSLLPFGVVKEGEQLGIDLVFQGRAHAVRPAGNDLELGAFHKLGGR